MYAAPMLFPILANRLPQLHYQHLLATGVMNRYMRTSIFCFFLLMEHEKPSFGVGGGVLLAFQYVMQKLFLSS